MLVLSRKRGESVLVMTDKGIVEVTLTAIEGSRVKLGFSAPRDVRIKRREIAGQDDKRKPTSNPET